MGDVITIPNPSLSVTDDGSTPKIDPKLAKLLLDAIILKDESSYCYKQTRGFSLTRRQ